MNQENDSVNPITPVPQPELPRPRRRWLRTTLFGMSILICGMVIGSGLTLRVLWVQLTEAIQNPDQMPERITHRMTRVLDLTEEQALEVRAILNREYYALESLRAEIAPRVQAELDKTRDEIVAVLDPDQARRWLKRFEFLRKRWTPPAAANLPPGVHRKRWTPPAAANLPPGVQTP